MLPALMVVLLCAYTANAWWDTGHMITAQIAADYSSPRDVDTLDRLLSEWNSDWPLSGHMPGASIWPDVLKCRYQGGPACFSDAKPSLRALDEWHWISLAQGVDGYVPSGERLNHELTFEEHGHAVDFLEEAVRTMSTTNSRWTANFMLRYFLHVFGDLHQPLHTSEALSARFPEGDYGGNRWTFINCSDGIPYNLHALWDSAGTKYLGVYRADNATTMLQRVRNDAASIRRRISLEASSDFDFVQLLDNQSPADRRSMRSVVESEKLFRRMASESHAIARRQVFSSLLPLNAVDDEGNIACPTAEYMAVVRRVSEQRLHVGGRRLAAVLRHFASAVRQMDNSVTASAANSVSSVLLVGFCISLFASGL